MCVAIKSHDTAGLGVPCKPPRFSGQIEEKSARKSKWGQCKISASNADLAQRKSYTDPVFRFSRARTEGPTLSCVTSSRFFSGFV